jgi:hypothetical protein
MEAVAGAVYGVSIKLPPGDKIWIIIQACWAGGGQSQHKNKRN